MSTQPVLDRPDGVLLRGLDGTNPLAFLAALGTLRVVDTTVAGHRTKMRWVPGNGTWLPELLGTDLDEQSFPDHLNTHLVDQIDDHAVSILPKLDENNPSRRHDLFVKLTRDASFADRSSAEWLAALASDITPPSGVSQLQTARRDYYFGNLASVIRNAKAEHLRRAVFHSWDYADPLDNQSLHLDPSEDRRHAHQWNKPAGDPDRKKWGGMLGANRLAIEAFSLFTSLPHGDALRTLGFTGQRSYNTRWTWPIWNVPISLQSVRSVLTLAELQAERISAEERSRLRSRGVVAAFRTARILVGKTPNFTPAESVA
jgi:hypothetical protein